MDLFDLQIEEVQRLISSQDIKELSIKESLLEDAGKNNMVFANEAAYELGGSHHRSLSFELVTSNRDLADHDAILLIGNDLSNIDQDCDFMRITLLNIKDDGVKGNELYSRLEKIKFIKYNVNPKGYMLRTAIRNREKIRVSKEITKYSFADIGSSYMHAYKRIPYVNSVQMIFITGDSALYDSLSSIVKKKDTIVDAIDHILKGLMINDCDHCSVKDLCEEVEELRIIHKGG